MKKIYSLSLFALAALSLSAQKNATLTSTPVNALYTSADVERSSIDTLSTAADWTIQAAIFGVGPDPNSGYVVGSNTYDDKQKVQIFYPTDISSNPAPFTVIGAMYWWGAKTVAGVNPGNVALKTYKFDGTTGTTTTLTSTAPCPGTVVVSDNLSMTLVDTANIQIHNFSAPSVFTTNMGGEYPFGVGFDITGINAANGDTVGLVSTADGNYDAIHPESAWEQWSDNTWHSLTQAWQGINIEMAIFPIAFNTASIDETPFLNGVRAFVPSPFANSTIFNYELLTNAPSVSINVVDMSGRIVYTKSINNGVEAGRYTLDFDGSSLNAGTYIMSVQAGKGRVATKFVKQ